MRATFVAAFFTVAGLLSVAVAEEPKRLNYRTAPGTDFVASLTFKPASIAKPDGSMVKFTYQGESVAKAANATSCLVFDEATLSDQPLKFMNRSTLVIGEKVKIAQSGNSFFIMKPKPEEKPKPDPVNEQPATKVVTLEDVKDVLVLDTKAKKTEFELLDGREKTSVLRAAAKVQSMKLTTFDGNDVLKSDVRAVLDNLNLFDREKVKKWILAVADENGVKGLFEIVGTPENKQDEVKIAFASLKRSHRQMAIRIATTIKATGGLTELKNSEKDFVRFNKVLFNLDE